MAYFDGLDLNNYGAAYVILQRPDFSGSKYPVLYMKRYDLDYQSDVADGPSQYFTPGGGPGVNGKYPCYLLDFADIRNIGDELDDDDDTIVTLLDTPGLWKAAITLVSNSGVYNVVGTMTFNVNGSEGPEVETELDPSVVFQNFSDVLASKLNIKSGIVVLPNLSADLTGYTEDQMFFVRSTNKFYELENGQLVESSILSATVSMEENEYIIPSGEE